MNDWSNLEVELIVADYFSMLSKELSGQSYNKAEHRRRLLPLLNKRSDGSCEFKHRNISAVLINLGQPYIKGYLPSFNYQSLLEDKVIDYLIGHQSLEEQFKQFADKEIRPLEISSNFSQLIEDAPLVRNTVEESAAAYTRNPIKTNYLEQEQQNRKLGFLGEEMALKYEKWQLIN